MSKDSKDLYEFGRFRVDAGERLVLAGGQAVPLTPKAFDLLLVLLDAPGHVLTKEELMKRVWPDSFVEEANLSHHVYKLREALEGADGQKVIETVPRRGYRFVAPVTRGSEADLVVEEVSRARIVIEEEEPPLPVSAPLTLPPYGPRTSRSALIPIAVAGLIVAVVVGMYFWRGRAPVAATIRTIAVLPFKPLVAADHDAALELGLTDALITKLSNIHQVLVRPTTSILRFGGENQDLKQAGAVLGADVLLDGRVHKAGDRIRLSVQLIRAADGTIVWAQGFDQPFSDIFAVQDSIADSVASALALRLTRTEKQGLSKRYTDNVEAYQLYLKGRYHWSSFAPARLLTSINFFNEALTKDPSYALAYAGLANAYEVIAIYGPLTATEVLPKASAAANRAVALDADLAQAQSALGGARLFVECDWPGAERALTRAKQLDPNLADAHTLYAYYLQAMGRTTDALAELRRAKDLAPEWSVPANDVPWGLFLARRYDESIDISREMIRLEPQHPTAAWLLGQSLFHKGSREEGLEQLRHAVELARTGMRPSRQLAELAYAYGVMGRKDEALPIISEIVKQASPWMPLLLAQVYSGIGDRDRAFEWLNRAVDARFSFTWRVKIMPQFDGLRADTRYAPLLRRMNLTP